MKDILIIILMLLYPIGCTIFTVLFAYQMRDGFTIFQSIIMVISIILAVISRIKTGVKI